MSKTKKYNKRVRFDAVEIGTYFKTEYGEECIKTDELRIITDRPINFRNMFNLTTKQMDCCNSGQWVWITELNQED